VGGARAVRARQLNDWLGRPWLGRCLLVMVALLLAGVCASLWPQWFARLDERSSDWVWQAVAREETERRVVVIDIDDASLAEVGPWPWPRPTVAELARKLDQQGVSLKLFDVVFPDAREGTADLSRALALRDNPGDRSAPSVVGQVFALRNESSLRVGKPAGALLGGGCTSPVLPAQGVIANAAGLHHRAGHITPTLDGDGAVRRVPALVCFEGERYPALSLAGLLALPPAGALTDIQAAPGKTWWEPAWSLNLPALPGQPVGVDAVGQMRVPYRLARSSFTAISAVDVLKGRVPSGVLVGTWVVVGASAFGLSDTVPTPLGGAVNGAEVHAQLLAGILDDAVPFAPRGALWLQVGAVLVGVLGLLALSAGSLLRTQKRVLWLPVGALLAAMAMYGLHAYALIQANWFVGWAAPACGTLLAGMALAAGEHARSLSAKSRLFQNLSSYVPSPVAEQIALTVPSGEIQAERGDVTVLAADVCNFSAYCEARTPEDTARVLHRFYKTASEIVVAHGGVIEEMVGDSLLAVFNGPHPCADHPLHALRAAQEIWLRCGEELPNTAGQGLEPLSIGIGVESGMALVGSFGSSGRRVHTVLGQTVTIAMRLRDMTTELAYPILVGAGAAHRIPIRIDDPGSALKSLGVFILPGLKQSGKIHTLRHLLQVNGPAEQQTLDYLNQQHIAA
jgi:adenylate cyclase